jgi:hypothetical protein
MAIGDLYDANNVVVGQAAVLFAPQYTALPTFDKLNLNDPFDPAPWVQSQILASATLSAGSFTLTYTRNGVAYTTTSLTVTTATAVQAHDAIVAALAPLTPATTDVIVTGGPVSAPATPFNIVLTEHLTGGVWTITPTGVTGGTLSVVSPLWVPCGATDQGWKFGANKSVQSISVEEQSTPTGQAINTQAVTIDGSLSEDISRTISLALNGILASSAPSVSLPGYDAITLSDIVQFFAVAMISTNAKGYPRIVYAPKWTQLANTQVDFRRSANKRMYPVQFATVCKPSEIAIYNVTSPHT